MPINVLFAGADNRWPDYQEALPKAFAAVGVQANLRRDHEPATVDYIVYAPTGPVQDFAPFTRCKAVLGLWAGVETIVGNPTLTQPLTRMVDSGLKHGMVEWVVGHTMRHHLGMDRHIHNPEHRWDFHVPPLAKDRKVAILGLGELGQACARALAGLGFPVHGWSARPKSLDGVVSHHGSDGLANALTGAAIVVLLLPRTPETENILNDRTLALTARGAFVLNPGRGPLIDDAALIRALDAGQIAHATLDTFRVEPLPQDHPFWTHPGVTVTPHIASETRTDTSAEVIAENIRRGEAGEPFLYLVDRSRGY